ncbi:hypothetical protein FQA39_LY17662 [Lamprigera yunnana]|nr:hypothetical protein FQA39_LY17662 [Lamprigera yunnana]
MNLTADKTTIVFLVPGLTPWLAPKETRKNGKGLKKIHKERWIFWSGADMKKRAKEGAGLIFASNKLKGLMQEEYGNERLLSVKTKWIDEEIWRIITVYGENEDARKKGKEQFYNELQRQINNGEDGRFKWLS